MKLLMMFLPFCGAVALREALVELRNDTAYDLEQVTSERRLFEPREGRAANVVESTSLTRKSLKEALVELRNNTAYDLEKVTSKRLLLEPREEWAANVVESTSITRNSVNKGDIVWKTFNGHSYAFFSDRKSWANAQMHCLGLGGYLAVINNQEEENFVERLSRGQTWVGLSDAQETGFWLWINSDPLCVTFWCPDEPNNAGGQEHCTEITSRTQSQSCWNDIKCSAPQPYVCERNTAFL